MIRFRRGCFVAVFLASGGCSDPLAPGAARVEMVLHVDANGDPHHPVTASATVINTGGRAVWHAVSVPPEDGAPPFRGLWIDWIDPADRRVSPVGCAAIVPIDTGESRSIFMLPGEAISNSSTFNGVFCPDDRPWASAFTNRETWTARATFVWHDGLGHTLITRKEVKFGWRAR